MVSSPQTVCMAMGCGLEDRGSNLILSRPRKGSLSRGNSRITKTAYSKSTLAFLLDRAKRAIFKVYRIPPIRVGVKDIEDLIPTIHPVKENQPKTNLNYPEPFPPDGCPESKINKTKSIRIDGLKEGGSLTERPPEQCTGLWPEKKVF